MGLQKTVGRASVVTAFSLAAILPLWRPTRNRGDGTPREREGAHKGRPYGKGASPERCARIVPCQKATALSRAPGPRRTRHRRDKAERAPDSGPRRRRGRRQALLGPEPRDGPGAAHGDLEHRRRRNLLWTARLPRPRHPNVHPGGAGPRGAGLGPRRGDLPCHRDVPPLRRGKLVLARRPRPRHPRPPNAYAPRRPLPHASHPRPLAAPRRALRPRARHRRPPSHHHRDAGRPSLAAKLLR